MDDSFCVKNILKMETFKRILIAIIFAAFIILLLTFPGCKEIQYVPVHTIDTVIVDNYIRDSIKTSDSVYVYRGNDTLYIYKEKVYYRDKLVTDTVYKNTVKEVPVPVEVEKVVEVEKSHKLRDILALFGLVSLLIIVGIFLYRLKRS